MLLAPIVISTLMVVPARADLLVQRLNGDGQADDAAAPCCVADEFAAVPVEKVAESNEGADASAVSLFVLSTVLFSNPDNTTPTTPGTSGGPTASGGSTNPPPTSHAPEPATVISALVGVGLAGFYVVFRRKRLAAPVN
jgi:hypothetical protein